ncbi:MAG: hypothetical protein KDD47_02490, partial [Acidobacteria bacterium]|nr:hypothetical protein [Acidobacteriota bacterium]
SPRKSVARHRKEIDVLGELEKLRREVQKPDLHRAGRASTSAPAGRNGHSEVHREIQLSVNRASFDKLRRLTFDLQVKGEDDQILESVKNFQVEFQDPKGLEKLLLRLNIALHSKG